MPVEAVEAVEAVVPAEAAAFEEEWAPKACAVPTGRGSVQLPLLEPAGPLMAPPGDREGAHGGMGGAARGIAASVRRPRAAREGSQPPDPRMTCVRHSGARLVLPLRTKTSRSKTVGNVSLWRVNFRLAFAKTSLSSECRLKTSVVLYYCKFAAQIIDSLRTANKRKTNS